MNKYWIVGWWESEGGRWLGLTWRGSVAFARVPIIGDDIRPHGGLVFRVLNIELDGQGGAFLSVNGDYSFEGLDLEVAQELLIEQGWEVTAHEAGPPPWQR